MKKKIIKYLFVILIVAGIGLNTHQSSYAFSEQVIQHGATGEDVVELQARLQYIGFYHGPIDGVFGWGTYWALRHFQDEFGMKVDGYAGDQVKKILLDRTQYHKDFVREHLQAGRHFTHYGGMNLDHQVRYDSPKDKKQTDKQKQTEQKSKEQKQTDKKAEQDKQQKEQAQKAEQDKQQKEQVQKDEAQNQSANDQANTNQETTDDSAIVEATPIEPTAVNVPNGFSQNDIRLMAQAVYGEARGEPYEGQVAVASVILNRLQSPIFPDTVAGVIYEPLAFTAVADGQIYLDPDETAKRAVLDAINGWDPTGEAIYYFNPNTATSTWIWSRPQIKQIGKHIFCK